MKGFDSNTSVKCGTFLEVLPFCDQCATKVHFLYLGSVHLRAKMVLNLHLNSPFLFTS